MTDEMVVELHRRKYAVLLALLCVALAIESVNVGSAERFLSDLSRTVLAVAMWVVIFNGSRERATMAAVLVATLVISWGRYFATASLERAMSLADQAAAAVFLWSAVYVILRDLFRTPATRAEDVLGTICGYLIAGDA